MTAHVDHEAVRRAMRRGGDKIARDRLYLGPSRPLTPPAPPRPDLGPCGHHPPCPGRATAGYLTGLRCPDHTPAAIAGRPETTPDPARTLEGIRKAHGANPEVPMTPAGGTLVDARAIASGKRRSNPQDYRAAQERTR